MICSKRVFPVFTDGSVCIVLFPQLRRRFARRVGGYPYSGLSALDSSCRRKVDAIYPLSTLPLVGGAL